MIIKETDEFINNHVGGQHMDFLWLMEHLLPYSDKIKGCELIFPDTVFYVNGKARIFIRSDKEQFLVGTKALSKLHKDNLQKELPNIYRDRRKDTHGIFARKYPTLATKVVPDMTQ